MTHSNMQEFTGVLVSPSAGEGVGSREQYLLLLTAKISPTNLDPFKKPRETLRAESILCQGGVC